MPSVLRGESVLFAAPTASGKTEAILAPLFQRHVSFRRGGTSVVYVAPTKALVNDLYARLTDYLGARDPDAIRRYTGDHHDFDVATRGFCLLATPEALDSLQLMRPNDLAGIRAIVIDEVHLLHGSPRGQQLRHVISRLQVAAAPPSTPRDTFQLVGMTATIDQMNEVAATWLGEAGRAITRGDPREIEMTNLSAPGRKKTELPLDDAKVVGEWLERSRAAKVLIFSNSRNGAHGLAAALSQVLAGSRWPVHLHMGVLSATERERVETAMREERFGVCVATSTLEIGIDIGDLDAIVLGDPPPTVSGFLQRIGRGNRRTGVCRVVVVCHSLDEQALFEALLDCARRGELDDVHEFDRPSVHSQQVISLLWRELREGKEPTLGDLRLLSGGIGHDAVVRSMLETGALREIRGALVPSDEWMDAGDARRIHTVIVGNRGPVVVDISSGEELTSGIDRSSDRSVMYVGGEFKRLRCGRDGGWYLEKPGGGTRLLARIPTSGSRRGMSRAVLWALARQEGIDPAWWQRDGSQLLTWGGLVFNRLLVALLEHDGLAMNGRANDVGVRGIPATRNVDLGYVKSLAQKEEVSPSLPRSAIRLFRDNTGYFDTLSPELQQCEERNSVPLLPFIRWLNRCSGVRN